MSSDTGKQYRIRDQYKYWKTKQFQENSVNKISNSLQPLREEKINWREIISKQANIQAELSKLEVRTTNSVQLLECLTELLEWLGLKSEYKIR